MKLSTACCACVMLAVAAAGCDAREFAAAVLDDHGHSLVLIDADGSRTPAPKLEDQDGFEAPAVARNRRYAGWLALYPGRGASYSQPLDLVVTDTVNRVHRFRGDFGMVFAWCFAREGEAVVYQSMFPHGMTPVAFEMRRVSDGKLLRRALLQPARADAVPQWARCTRDAQPR